MSSELRTKFIAEMNLHGLAANTQRGYVTSVRVLAAYYKESPEKLTDELFPPSSCRTKTDQVFMP